MLPPIIVRGPQPSLTRYLCTKWTDFNET